MSNRLVERFFKYVKIDTISDPESTTCPSTEKQFNLANLLVKELKEMGLSDANVDENGYVMATLKGNTDKEVPTIGLIAHMDTSPAFSGKDVNPIIHESYDGKDIVLNSEQNIILSTKDFPDILDYVGQDIITTDGTTLLGADDKAGIAEIMEAVLYFIENPDVKHGDIKIGFTPDEEIGRGANKFDIEKFGADFAYTVDGCKSGELAYMNFNAAGAKVIIAGRSVHPGSAKDKMINAITIGHEFNSLLPSCQVPQHTEGTEGFFHLYKSSGDIEKSTLQYIIRDHDREKFEAKKELMIGAMNYLNSKYGKDTVKVELTEQYSNMAEKIEPVMHIVDNAKAAMIEAGLSPFLDAVRGGTDGARLSFMGLPCPNMFTGGHNFHGRFEYVPIQSMEKAVEVIVKLLHNYAK